MQCQAFTKSGAQCKRDAVPGSAYCSIPAHKAMGEPNPVPEQELEEVQIPEELPEPGLCGHMNLHHYEATEEKIFCDLPEEHDGAHSAEYFAVDYKDTGISFEGIKRTYWTDQAGTSVKDIKQEPIPRTVEEIARKAALDAILEMGPGK